MADRYRKKWSREETILAFDLYCRIPFSRISKTNKDIVELARIIGRTPSSVGLKMANLAHYDPELKLRNVSGMSNTSKLDREIFEEFSNDWEELSYQAQVILAHYRNTDIQKLNPQFEIGAIPEGQNNEVITKARVGQYFFRMAVLNSYRNMCCVTGIREPELLNASHIKPWSVSDSKTERTNPSNGLCLNVFHDRAFDRGFITIDTDYKIIVSSKLKNIDMDEETKDWLRSYENKQIILPDRFYPSKVFIEYHNDVVFQS